MKKEQKTKHYCTYEDVHTGCYDCNFCDKGYVCLGNECIYRETMWKITVNVYKSHLDWDIGTNKVASIYYVTLGNNLPEKAESIIKRIQEKYSEDIWCDYTLKLLVNGCHERVVDDSIKDLINGCIEVVF